MPKEKISPKQDVSRRLKIVGGHLRKIIEMVDSGVYCIDILQQTAAVKSAIKKAEEVLLTNHISHCVVKAINANGRAKEKAIEELVQVFRKIN
jgi:DNA-binding FrmR family transcriptional regulator